MKPLLHAICILAALLLFACAGANRGQYAATESNKPPPEQETSIDWGAVLLRILSQTSVGPATPSAPPPPAPLQTPGQYYIHRPLYTSPKTTECRWVNRITGPVWRCQ